MVSVNFGSIPHRDILAAIRVLRELRGGLGRARSIRLPARDRAARQPGCGSAGECSVVVCGGIGTILARVPVEDVEK
jgi:hypothetical protein